VHNTTVAETTEMAGYGNLCDCTVCNDCITHHEEVFCLLSWLAGWFTFTTFKAIWLDYSSFSTSYIK